MKRTRHVDFIEKAQAAWGKDMPVYVRELANEANRTSATAAGKKIGYSTAVVSHVLAKAYPGDMAKVEAKIRGALMGETVICPIVGEIGRDRCLDEQAKPFVASSSVRTRIYRACRSGCPHSRLGGDDAES